MKSMWGRVIVLSVPLVMAACTAEREMSRSITNLTIEEPRYCYQYSVGRDGIVCYVTPVHRDERRLVGYTGPPPSHYPKPTPKPEPKLYAPAAVTYWVKDAELIPEAAPVPPGRRIAPPPLSNSMRESSREKFPIKNSSSNSTLKSSDVLIERLVEVPQGAQAKD